MNQKQKNNSMRNIFISQIISNKPKQPHQQKTKIPQENSKKQYIYEESINLIKNDQKSKQNINPCSKHTIKAAHSWYIKIP